MGPIVTKTEGIRGETVPRVFPDVLPRGISHAEEAVGGEADGRK